jgi:hypothetical protein
MLPQQSSVQVCGTAVSDYPEPFCRGMRECATVWRRSANMNQRNMSRDSRIRLLEHDSLLGGKDAYAPDSTVMIKLLLVGCQAIAQVLYFDQTQMFVV